MTKDRQKLLDTLFENGYKEENRILQIGLPQILAMHPKLTFPQMELLNALQDAIRTKKLLLWIAGDYPEAPAEAPTDTVEPASTGYDMLEHRNY